MHCWGGVVHLGPGLPPSCHSLHHPRGRHGQSCTASTRLRRVDHDEAKAPKRLHCAQVNILLLFSSHFRPDIRGIQPYQNHRSCQYKVPGSKLDWWCWSPCTEVEHEAGQLEGGQTRRRTNTGPGARYLLEEARWPSDPKHLMITLVISSSIQ